MAFDRQNPHYKGFSVINTLKWKWTPGKGLSFLNLSVSVLLRLEFLGPITALSAWQSLQQYPVGEWGHLGHLAALLAQDMFFFCKEITLFLWRHHTGSLNLLMSYWKMTAGISGWLNGLMGETCYGGKSEILTYGRSFLCTRIACFCCMDISLEREQNAV